jgi:segregation and condensation protein A
MLAQRVPVVHLAPRAVDPPVHIPAYDGPLDLLLFLVRREGLALREIPIARICDAYLSYLDDLEEIDVDTAGDYLVMSATLCQLKARELLPRAERPAEDEEEDPREALERRLREYERYRAAAEDLGRRERLDRDVFARPLEPLKPEEAPLEAGTDALGLARLYYGLRDRRAEPPPVHRVDVQRYTLAARARMLLRHLDDGQEHLLAEILGPIVQKSTRIVTFLAVLEMARLRMVDIWQRVHLGAVGVRALLRADEADLTALGEEGET